MKGDGGGFSSPGYSGGSDFQDRPSRSAQYEEYDEFDDGGARASVQRSSIPRKSTPKEKATPAKEVDLFNFDDDVSTTATTSNGKGKAVEPSEDDDFDDFQSASGTSTTSTSTKPTTTMPSIFNPPPLQSNPVRPIIPSISSTSTFPGLGISPPPLQQPARTPNLQTSFGGLTPSSTASAIPTSTTANYQPNYFSQPTPTTVLPSPFSLIY